MHKRYHQHSFADKQKTENELKKQTQRDSTIEALEKQLEYYSAKVKIYLWELISCAQLILTFCQVKDAEALHADCEENLREMLNGIENLFRFVLSMFGVFSLDCNTEVSNCLLQFSLFDFSVDFWNAIKRRFWIWSARRKALQLIMWNYFWELSSNESLMLSIVWIMLINRQEFWVKGIEYRNLMSKIWVREINRFNNGKGTIQICTLLDQYFDSDRCNGADTA